jgi:hypothetical protein
LKPTPLPILQLTDQPLKPTILTVWMPNQPYWWCRSHCCSSGHCLSCCWGWGGQQCCWVLYHSCRRSIGSNGWYWSC